jgi:hypothetical protein
MSCEYGFPPNAPEGYRARVDYAVTDDNITPPAATSFLWRTAGSITSEGEVITPELPSGAIVWIRARGEAPGRRPSAWTEPVVFIVGSAVRFLAFDVDTTGRITWTANQFTGGVRLDWALHADGSIPSPSLGLVDLDASVGFYETGSVPAPGQRISALGEPWTGFESGAVTGDRGLLAFASALRPAS